MLVDLAVLGKFFAWYQGQGVDLGGNRGPSVEYPWRRGSQGSPHYAAEGTTFKLVRDRGIAIGQLMALTGVVAARKQFRRW